MKSKLVLLSLLCASVVVQARTVHIPPLETLQARLVKEFTSNSVDDAKLLALIKETQFFQDFAGKEVDAADLVRQIKCLCLVHRIGRKAFYDAYYTSSDNEAALAAEKSAIEAFFAKEGEKPMTEGRLAQLYGGETSFSLATPAVRGQLSKLYRVFFNDYEHELLNKLLDELYRAVQIDREKQN
jgi:hypothetical protein